MDVERMRRWSLVLCAVGFITVALIPTNTEWSFVERIGYFLTVITLGGCGSYWLYLEHREKIREIRARYEIKIGAVDRWYAEQRARLDIVGKEADAWDDLQEKENAKRAARIIVAWRDFRAVERIVDPSPEEEWAQEKLYRLEPDKVRRTALLKIAKEEICQEVAVHVAQRRHLH